MRTLLHLLFLGLLLICASARAGDPRIMNGYELKNFGDFTKWKQVTVRFRKDTDEMRFVYANDLAWDALQAGKTDFPDGAIFAKIGVMTQPDPAFPSSVTPSGARRVQLMVRDKARHKDADGWGYALFDSNGKVLAEDEKLTTQACVACHRLVPERGEVFSQIFAFRTLDQAAAPSEQKIRFVDRKVSTLPRSIRKLMPLHAGSVRVLEGALTETPFAGTLDEIQPVLAAEVVRSSRPALLVARDGKMFSLVLRDKAASPACASGQISLKGVHNLASKTKLYRNTFCQ